ncbi:hypothetical protein LRY65_04280 [Candidatus Woesebacteria bacterium]|nr:hypothetical protein [Candidatus Woesebacteria bacterium]MCD8507555.1 hypothetical protein [Candidatus Woesebacteria bacterium]MCD8527396.1 hypothetical protein [Candidatus Woesebacteria bacterium]MCD8546143.1 hypothetical protein [Candidatus Woesebacteria bacterium]
MRNSKIVRTDLLEVALPLTTPYKTGFGTLADRNTLLVRLETEDGLDLYVDESWINRHTIRRIKSQP